MSDRIIDAHGHPAVLLESVTSSTATPPSLAHLLKHQKLIAGLRILESQWPRHNPTHQPLPQFADRWFRSYDDGADVAHWYAAAAGQSTGTI